MIFDETYEKPLKFHKTDQGTLELVGCRITTEMYSNAVSEEGDTATIGTYAPYSVLTVSEDTLVMDEDATRDYNKEHYLWLGPDYSEKVKILYYWHHGKTKELTTEKIISIQ